MRRTSYFIPHFTSNTPSHQPPSLLIQDEKCCRIRTFLALSFFVASDGTQAAPALRGLRSSADTPAVEDDESRKDHHHHVKKVKKIAIPVPVPVEVPQFIPVPVSVPSTVVASSNTAVVDSSTNVAAAPGVPAGLGVPEPVTPAPTRLSRRPAATPAATSTRRSRAMPAPTSLANVGTSGAQLPGAQVTAPQGGGAGMAGILASPGFGGNNNAFGAGFGPSAGMGGGFNGNGVGGFGQQMGSGTPGGNAFGGFGGQGTMGIFVRLAPTGLQLRLEGNSALAAVMRLEEASTFRLTERSTTKRNTVVSI